MSAYQQLTTIAPQLAKLVRLLGSEVDGEALAAARAIGRTLGGAGADFHDLASLLERGGADDAVEIQIEIEMLRSSVADLTRQLAEAGGGGRVAELQRDLEWARAECGRARAEMGEAKAKALCLEAQMFEARRALPVDLAEEVQMLRRRLEAADSERAALKAEVASLQPARPRRARKAVAQ